MIPSPDDLAKSRKAYVRWMNETWDTEKLGTLGKDVVFFYSVQGSAMGRGFPAEKWLRALKRDPDSKEVPAMRQRSWADIGALETFVKESTGGYRLMPWVMMPVGHWERNYRLDKVHQIGPKIAAWILRDLSLWMDYTPDLSRKEVVLATKADNGWFLRLEPWAQAYYLPIDRWVHRACVHHGVYTEAEMGTCEAIQQSQKTHVAAAKRLAGWCAGHQLDPRVVNLHWFRQGESGEVSYGE